MYSGGSASSSELDASSRRRPVVATVDIDAVLEQLRLATENVKRARRIRDATGRDGECALRSARATAQGAVDLIELAFPAGK